MGLLCQKLAGPSRSHFHYERHTADARVGEPQPVQGIMLMPGPQRYSHNQRDSNEEPLLALAAQLGGCWREALALDGWVWVRRIARWMPVEIELPEREHHA